MKNFTKKYCGRKVPNSIIAFFKHKPLALMSMYDRWRKVAKMQNVSHDALKKLEWIIYYETKGKYNASKTSRYFGIAPKTFYKYLNRFDSTDFHSLEEISRRPRNLRQRMITLEEEKRVIALRRQYIHWGKEKLREEYNTLYKCDISDWKIFYTIQKHNLYPDVKKITSQRNKSKSSVKKKKITDLTTTNQNVLGHLLQIDTIVLHLFGLRRYILTAIDRFGKIAFARVYRNHSSQSAADFLQRLNYLLNNEIINIQTDNGSEFQKNFIKAAKTLKLDHYFSRVRTPKDNCYVERFNRTLQEEWLNHGNFYPDVSQMNKHLTEWLVYYNFKRRHHSLGNLSPIDYCIKYKQLLPMYSTRTYH